MPISTKLFKIKNYPSLFPIETEPTNTGLGDDFLLKTKVEYLGLGEYPEKEIDKLNITHDKGSAFKGIGYSADGGRVEDLISIAEERRFPVFVFPEKEYLFACFSSKEMYNQALKRLSQYGNAYDKEGNNSLITNPTKIKMQELKQSFDEDGPKIRGGWFRDLRITNVDVAYIGGGEVHDSDEWFKYEQSGTISALRLDYPNPDVDGEPFRLLITHDGSIFSYKTFSESEFLQIVVPIFEYLIPFTE